MNRKHTRTQGFTLIELLVVIAIIAVLAGILIPSYSAAQKRPYDVSTLQCGKAIATAQITYAAEHNNQPATSTAQLNDADVTEQCGAAGVQISNNMPGSVSEGGNFNINVAGSNYSYLLWHQRGTAIYNFNRDVPSEHFHKLN